VRQAVIRRTVLAVVSLPRSSVRYEGGPSARGWRHHDSDLPALAGAVRAALELSPLRGGRCAPERRRAPSGTRPWAGARPSVHIVARLASAHASRGWRHWNGARQPWTNRSDGARHPEVVRGRASVEGRQRQPALVSVAPASRVTRGSPASRHSSVGSPVPRKRCTRHSGRHPPVGSPACRQSSADTLHGPRHSSLVRRQSSLSVGTSLFG
jgi:hypothetical protein